jgi:hypothetical protein
LETARATARTLITLTPATPAQNARKISAKFKPLILGEVHTAGNTFDILALDGEDLRPLPLSMRKTNLARLLARRPDGIFVAPFEQGEIGPDLFRAACNVGLEGLVSKRIDRPYRGGRSHDWVKVKNRKHILVAYRHGLSEGLGKGTTASVEPKSEHAQLDCGPDPTSPALRASSASFVKIFFPAMRPDSQAPVI